MDYGGIVTAVGSWIMKRLLAGLALMTAAAALSGCYYDPGYSYVRSSGYAGDAYYGRGSDAYYAAPGYYDGYYGGGYYGNAYYGDGYYGCCYGPALGIGVVGGYYSRPGYRHHDDDDRRGYSHGGYHAQGGRGRPPSSRHSRGGDHPRGGERHDHRH